MAAMRAASLRTYAAHGHPPRRVGRRAAPGDSSPRQSPSLDPFRTVLTPLRVGDDGRCAPAPYLALPASLALPIAMLRSGHLMPLPGDDTPPPPTGDAHCPYCGDHVSRDGQEPPVRELPWLHICHQLLRCQADALAPRVRPCLISVRRGTRRSRAGSLTSTDTRSISSLRRFVHTGALRSRRQVMLSMCRMLCCAS